MKSDEFLGKVSQEDFEAFISRTTGTVNLDESRFNNSQKDEEFNREQDSARDSLNNDENNDKNEFNNHIEERTEEQIRKYNIYASKVANLDSVPTVSELLLGLFKSEVDNYTDWNDQNLGSKAYEIEQLYKDIRTLPSEVYAYAITRMRSMNNITPDSFAIISKWAIQAYEIDQRNLNPDSVSHNKVNPIIQTTEREFLNNVLKEIEEYRLSANEFKSDIFKVMSLYEQLRNTEDSAKQQKIKKEIALLTEEIEKRYNDKEYRSAAEAFRKKYNVAVREKTDITRLDYNRNFVIVKLAAKFQNTDLSNSPEFALDQIQRLLTVNIKDYKVIRYVEGIILKYILNAKLDILDEKGGIDQEKFAKLLKKYNVKKFDRTSITYEDVTDNLKGSFKGFNEMEATLDNKAIERKIRTHIKEASNLGELEEFYSKSIIDTKNRLLNSAFKNLLNYVVLHPDEDLELTKKLNLLMSSSLILDPILTVMKTVNIKNMADEDKIKFSMEPTDAMLFASSYAYTQDIISKKIDVTVLKRKMDIAMEQFKELGIDIEAFYQNGRVTDFKLFEEAFEEMRRFNTKYNSKALTGFELAFEAPLRLNLFEKGLKDQVSAEDILDIVKNSKTDVNYLYIQKREELKKGVKTVDEVVDDLVHEYYRMGETRNDMIPLMKLLYEKEPEILEKFVNKCFEIRDSYDNTPNNVIKEPHIVNFISAFEQGFHEVIETRTFTKEFFINSLQFEDPDKLNSEEKIKRIVQLFNLENDYNFFGRENLSYRLKASGQELDLIKKYLKGLQNTEIIIPNHRLESDFNGSLTIDVADLKAFVDKNLDSEMDKRRESYIGIKLDISKEVDKLCEDPAMVESYKELMKNRFVKNPNPRFSRSNAYVARKLGYILRIQNDELRDELFECLYENFPEEVEKTYRTYNRVVLDESTKTRISATTNDLSLKRNIFSSLMTKYNFESKKAIDEEYGISYKFESPIISLREEREYIYSKTTEFTDDIQELLEDSKENPLTDKEMNVLKTFINSISLVASSQTTKFITTPQSQYNIKLLNEVRKIRERHMDNRALGDKLEDICVFWAKETHTDICEYDRNAKKNILDRISNDKVKNQLKDYNVTEDDEREFEEYLGLSYKEKIDRKRKEDANDIEYMDEQVEKELMSRFEIRMQHMVGFAEDNLENLKEFVEENVDYDLIKNPKIVELYIEEQKKLPKEQRNDSIIEVLEEIVENFDISKYPPPMDPLAYNSEYMDPDEPTGMKDASIFGKFVEGKKAKGPFKDRQCIIDERLSSLTKIERMMYLIEEKQVEPEMIEVLYDREKSYLNTEHKDVDLLTMLNDIRKPKTGKRYEEHYYKSLIDECKNGDIDGLNATMGLMTIYLLNDKDERNRMPETAMLAVSRIAHSKGYNLNEIFTEDGRLNKDEILKLHKEEIARVESQGVIVEVPKTIEELDDLTKKNRKKWLKTVENVGEKMGVEGEEVEAEESEGIEFV